MGIEKYIREDLKGWVNYQVQPVTGRKMDANESPFPIEQEVRQQLAEWLLEDEDLRYYPDTDAVELRKTIASYYGVDMDQITCGVGSDQIIEYLTKLFLEPGDTILVPAPSFSMYATAAVLNRGTAVAFELDPAQDFVFPVDDILEKMQELKPKILFLCTPNNPTGSSLSKEDLVKILEQADCIVALDEAYGEFAGQNNLDLIAKYPNVISLRTFSKAYGLAGLRVGYAIGNPEIIQAIDTVRAPYNLNTFSQKAAQLVLGRPEYKEHIAWICQERDRMYALLKEWEGRSGLYCYPSDANFLLMRSEVENLGDKLLEQGLLVRKYKGNMASYIRVSVADQESNDRFIKAMGEII